jgi:hypothetical protein
MAPLTQGLTITYIRKDIERAVEARKRPIENTVMAARAAVLKGFVMVRASRERRHVKHGRMKALLQATHAIAQGVRRVRRLPG